MQKADIYMKIDTDALQLTGTS